MIRNIIGINISGIKCDYCDYRKDDVKFEEYENYLHINCPKCGKPLLTENDYNISKKLIRKFERLNLILNFLQYLSPFYYIRKLFKIKYKYSTLKFNFKHKK
jgi:DNA-directed RNA polymerase subunit RPC12/RpoP